ncbi:MAG: ExbD/TolR family protein [Cyclobacteriaceae bacterium]
MNLKQKSKIEATFSMSGMTDVIFLLLIFFMLTSSITPSGVPVSIPSSKKSQVELEKVSVKITKDRKYYVQNIRVKESELETAISNKLPSESINNIILIYADKNITHGEAMKVAGIAASLNAKVSFAVKPE